jgi:hypothetical protein
MERRGGLKPGLKPVAPHLHDFMPGRLLVGIRLGVSFQNLCRAFPGLPISIVC